ncbi:hypothetical protein, partial [Aeromonas jandaei]|uniref:hypothetical protein n=1 Tax=Aeromonas jandaei TaxID=650 RepID=UPI0038B69CD0
LRGSWAIRNAKTSAHVTPAGWEVLIKKQIKAHNSQQITSQPPPKSLNRLRFAENNKNKGHRS